MPILWTSNILCYMPNYKNIAPTAHSNARQITQWCFAKIGKVGNYKGWVKNLIRQKGTGKGTLYSRA